MAAPPPAKGGDDDKEKSVAALDNFEVALASITRQLEPLLAMPWTTVLKSLKDEERAKLCVALAYATHSLYYMFLRTKGQSTKNHRVQAELERVKTYMTRLQIIKAPPARPSPPPSLQPSFKLDAKASARFITAALRKEGQGKKEGGREEEEEEEEGEEGEEEEEEDEEGGKRGSPRGKGGEGKKNKKRQRR